MKLEIGEKLTVQNVKSPLIGIDKDFVSMKNSFILANITWNSKGWERPSPDRSGFKWVAKNPEKHVAGESWNFKPILSALRHGFFENLSRPVRYFRDGGVVFFITRNISENKKLLVGLYADAKLFVPKQKSNGRPYSIEAPTHLCLKLPEYLPFNPQRHVPRGKTLSRYFLYLSEREARNIFSDMLSFIQHIDLKTANKLKIIAQKYFPDIKATARKRDNQKSKVPFDNLKDYEKKEIDEHTDQAIVKIIKNNTKLRESFVNHEKTKAIIANYLSKNRFHISRNKHLDLFARKHRKSLIVEVKSCTGSNIELQIRHGISQLWYYSYLYREKLHRAKCCLVLQCEPPEKLLRFVIDHCGFDLAYISGGRVVYHNGKKSC
jgi:hypothetical protein